MLLLSEVVVFAFHIKSFSDWERQIENMKTGQRLLAYERLDELLDEEELAMRETANNMVEHAKRGKRVVVD